jgi:hypothetical protein
MNAITHMPAATARAGVSSAELAVMRQAAGRLGAAPAGTAGLDLPDPFGALAAPFLPSPPGARATWKKEGSHRCYP